MKLLLDTNVLVRICHPTGHRDVKEWLHSLLQLGDGAPEILISVLADYELRRTLIQRGLSASIARLDELARSVTYVPVTPEVVRRGAEISAQLPREARSRLSDADVLMAAQAEVTGAILITSDTALRSIPGITARDWNEVEAAAAAR